MKEIVTIISRLEAAPTCARRLATNAHRSSTSAKALAQRLARFPFA
jgi:hypothetical protein